MGIFSGFVLYVLIWWTVIFVTLPFGNKPANDATVGHVRSAPAAHGLGKKALITTIASFLLWLPLHPLLESLLDHLRDDARQMSIEDEVKK